MTTEPTTQRLFTAAEYVDPQSERTLQSVYRDQDLGTLVEWVNPGGGIFEPIHSHTATAHVFVFLEGEGEALLGRGEWQKIGAGQFIVQPREKVHGIRNTSPTQRLVWVTVSVRNGPSETRPGTEDAE